MQGTRKVVHLNSAWDVSRLRRRVDHDLRHLQTLLLIETNKRDPRSESNLWRMDQRAPCMSGGPLPLSLGTTFATVLLSQTHHYALSTFSSHL